MQDYSEKISKINALADQLEKVANGIEGDKARELATSLAIKARQGASKMEASMIGPDPRKPSVMEVIAPASVQPKLDNVMTDEEVVRQELALGSEGRAPAMRNFAQGFSFGWADEAEAGVRAFLNNTSYDTEKEKIRLERAAYAMENPTEATLQELSGAVLAPFPSIKGAGLSPTSKGLLEGGIAGSLYGAGTAEAGETTKGALEGGVVGGVFGAITSKTLNTLVPMADNIRSMGFKAALKRAEKTPTVEALKGIRDEAYKVVNMDDKLLGADDIWTLRKGFAQIAADNGYLPEKTTKTVIDRALTLINNKGVRSVKEYEALRKGLSGLANDPIYGGAVKQMISKLDDVADAKIAASGNTTLIAAREAHKAYAKAKMFDDAFESARITLKNTGKEANAYDSYRAAAEKVLKSKDSRYLSKEEKAMVENFLEGRLPDRVMSKMARLAPSSTNFWAMMHLAGAISTMNPVLLTSVVATEGAKFLKDKRAVTQAKQLVDSLGGASKMRELMSVNPAIIQGGIMNFNSLMDVYFPTEESK